MGELERALVVHILGALGEAHPFRLSRTLFLLDLEHYRRHGGPLTKLPYVFSPYGFYIRDFPRELESMAEVEKVVVRDDKGNPVRGFFRLREGVVPPEIPREVREMVEEVLKRVGDLDDQELNALVLRQREYGKLLRGELPGWTVEAGA